MPTKVVQAHEHASVVRQAKFRGAHSGAKISAGGSHYSRARHLASASSRARP